MTPTVKKFHVTYFYHGQGMFDPEIKDYGGIEANSAEEAKHIIAVRETGYKEWLGALNGSDYKWFISCLSATEVVT
jgi:hypothetical protein